MLLRMMIMMDLQGKIRVLGLTEQVLKMLTVMTETTKLESIQMHMNKLESTTRGSMSRSKNCASGAKLTLTACFAKALSCCTKNRT